MSNVKHAPEIFALLYCDRLYKLEKGDRIEFAFGGSANESFSIDEYDEENRILTLECEEFFVMVDGKPVHWEKFQSNVEN